MKRRLILAILSLGAVLLASPLRAEEDLPLSSQGDPARGRMTFVKCQACHNLSPDGPVKLGPNLDNIFGRLAGMSPSYNRYSKALKESGIVWSEQALDEWLKNPQNFLPGNKMPFAGIRSGQERADLMAFLRRASQPNGNEGLKDQ